MRRRTLWDRVRLAQTPHGGLIEPLSALFRPVWTENERVDYMSPDVAGRHLHGAGPFSPTSAGASVAGASVGVSGLSVGVSGQLGGVSARNGSRGHVPAKSG